jgi:hypothetical protein
MGIETERFYLPKSLADFTMTLERMAMAGRWKTEHKEPGRIRA